MAPYRNNNINPPKRQADTKLEANNDVKVSSPYNFVPLNQEVFFPEWGPFVSHDVPFEDSLSGSINIEIEAQSPIFIGSGKDGHSPEVPQEFVHLKLENDQKRYFIPGSSFRNMLRSVVEILGFGKMNKVDELTDYSYRDMNNANLYSIRGNVSQIQMGWLQKSDDKIYILPCGKLGDLRNENPNTIFQKDLIADMLKNSNQIVKISEAKTIEMKYTLLSNYSSFPLATQVEDSDADKILVLTGQIERKEKEFLFPNPNNIQLAKRLKVEKEVFENFEFAYSNADESGKAWKFWRKDYFEKGKFIPIFFRYNGNEIQDFGLTVLYKLSYENGIFSVLDTQQKKWESKDPDLADTIFGNINKDKIKGRIFVNHAFTQNAVEDKKVDLILGTPKPKFYPFYMKQCLEDKSTNLKYERNKDGSIKTFVDRNRNVIKEQINFQTFNDEKAELAGRKRYPIQEINPNQIIGNKSAWKTLLPLRDPNAKDNKEVNTVFTPLKEGAIFKTQIHYHNLKSEELGALLSALTFHGQGDDYFHNIGLAKPFGFGKIKIRVSNLSNEEINKYLGEFEQCMNEHISDWIKSPQINELLAMAKEFRGQNREKLKYPDLKSFAEIKKKKLALPNYSTFMNIEIKPNSKITK